jgi:membrane peptidoglycan carboxypeptidase
MPIRKYYQTIIPNQQKERKRGIKNKKTHLWPKIVGGVLLFFFLLGIGAFTYFASQTPNIEDLGERTVLESTKIYDRSGSNLLYEAGEQKKTSVGLDQISPLLQKATLAAEDDDFYSHPGIDFKSILRALAYDILRRGESMQGGSTITQQLIKNIAFLQTEGGEVVGPAPRTLTRKIKETIMALEMERKYSKDQILEAYLNEIPYGSVFYGIEAASEGYFQKPSSDLTSAEAATLAGITRSPTYYLKNPEERENRKNWVLDRMAELNFVTKEEAEKAKEEKIALNPTSQTKKAPYFTIEVEKQLEEMYGENYSQMGLRVYTTLDFNLQTLAENTVKDWSPKLENWYGAGNASLVSINPNNGEILAMVGGRNFEESQVNIWTPESSSGLQSPGSAFKPVVYATAFKKGYTPNTVLWDVKTNFTLGDGKPFIPDNYDLKQRGPVKMKEALGQSLNIPAVKTLYLAGIQDTINTAKSMGMIDTFDLDSTDPGLSMAIGGKSVVPLELVSAFGVFATEGIRYLPNYILKIENSKGEVIYQPESHPIQALDSEICRQINSILSDNDLRAPMFGSRSWLYLNPWTAVKTGTASTEKGKITDAWTIGYTRDLVTGVWVGNNDNKPMYGRISGSTGAAPIWNAFMKEAEKNMTPKAFTSPKQIKTGKAVLDSYLPKTTVKIDKVSGKLATDKTPANLIEEKSYYEAHSILWWAKKDDPRGEYPKNPYEDPATKNWEAGVQIWTKDQGGEFQLPTEKDNLHTTENIPKIEIISQKITPATDSENNPIPLEERKIDFAIKITASLGVKKVEVFLDGNNISSIESSEKDQSFSYNLKTIGEKEQYNFKIIVTDTAENKGETEFQIQ